MTQYGNTHYEQGKLDRLKKDLSPEDVAGLRSLLRAEFSTPTVSRMYTDSNKQFDSRFLQETYDSEDYSLRIVLSDRIRTMSDGSVDFHAHYVAVARDEETLKSFTDMLWEYIEETQSN